MGNTVEPGDRSIFDREYDVDSAIVIHPKDRDFAMYVTPRYRSHYQERSYEPYSANLVAAVISRADVFIDVGANYGFYTLVAATRKPNLRVIALEPIPETYVLLGKNIGLNELTNVVALEAAASDVSGTREIIKSFAADSCSFYEHPFAPALGSIRVETVTIDGLLTKDPSDVVVVKIDTDGSELAVLAGMGETLSSGKEIALIIELKPKMLLTAGRSPEELLDGLSQLGFVVYFLDEASYRAYRIRSNGDWRQLMAPEGYANLFCVRKDRALSVCMFSHSAALNGAERSLLELAAELVSDHWALCTVIVPGIGPLNDLLRSSGVGVIEAAYGWWCDCQSTAGTTTIAMRLAESIRPMLAHVVPLLMKVAPDVILTQTIVIPWGSMCSVLLNVPHVWSICEYGEKDHGLKFLFPFDKVIEDINDSSSFIFFNNKGMAIDLFPNLEPNRQAVLYRHITIPCREVTDADGHFRRAGALRLGLFASYQPGKGQEYAVLAVAELVSRGRDVELLLAGNGVDGEYGQKLAAMIEEHSIGGCVRMVGFIDNPFSAMAETDIHICCSRYEAFGRAVAEAMLLGKPIIYPRSGGPSEYMIDGETGLSHAPGDWKELAEKIEILADDQAMREDLGRRARERASALFTKEQYGGKAWEILRHQVAIGCHDDHFHIPSTIRESLVVTISDTFAALAEKDAALAEKDAALAEKDAFISKIVDSWWWPLTAPVRWARRKLIQR